MLFENIKIGDRLEISLARENSIGKSYVSQVEDIISAQKLLVHMPISYGQLVKLSSNDAYSILFFTEKGMVKFNAKIVSYSKENEFNYMTVELTSQGERIQRREFFRFSCLLPIKFGSVDEDDSDGLEEPELHDGIIKDLGGGGIRYVSNASIEENKLVKNIFMLNDEYIIVLAKILHKQYFPKSNYKYQYRVEFLGISQKEQEKIIQYIFEEQRKSMVKMR